MLKVIQAYLQGARHRTNNLPCEDRTYSMSKNGVEVIALADGAGSQKYSSAAQGAECVAKTICEFFCNHFDDAYNTENEKTVKYAIMTICQDALKERAKELGIDDIITMSSTLLCVAVKGTKVVSVHIGDGVIGGIINNSIVTVSAPDNGEFASTTYFITMPKANEYLHIKKSTTQGADVFFMMSDGVQEYSFDEQNNVFTNGAAKMALFVYERDGQQRLENTIQNALINEDSASDDCSFIALRISDKKPVVNYDSKTALTVDESENYWSKGEVDMDFGESSSAVSYLGGVLVFAIIALFGIVMCLSAFETVLTFESTSGKEIAVPFLVIQKKLAHEVEYTVNQFIENRMNDTNNRDQTNRIVDAINARY